MSTFSDFNGLGKTEPICGDSSCYRGRVGGWNYQFKDGPCGAADCKWPVDDTGDYRPRRPHFTDTPAAPIVDAGNAALKEVETLRRLAREGADWEFSAAVAAFRPAWRGRLSEIRARLLNQK